MRRRLIWKMNGLLGDRLLAAPVTGTRRRCEMFTCLPAAGMISTQMRPVAGGKTLPGAGCLWTQFRPIFVRGRSCRSVRSFSPQVWVVEDPLEVRVYPGKDASFTLYEDDGDTYAYQRGAASSRIPMRWDDRARTLTVGVRAGTFPGMLPTRHLNVVLPDGSRKNVTYTGRTVQVRFTP